MRAQGPHEPADLRENAAAFLRLFLTCLWFGFICAFGAVHPAEANQVFGASVDPAALCQAAVRFAEQVQSLPPGILHAMGIVESGRPDAGTGQEEPWPWTINANGTGHVYPTEQDAIAAAQAFQAAGVRSLDIGCLQVNLLQHPHAFADLPHAFAPAENALYAGRFLRQLKGELGSWNAAIAAYHSQTPALGLPYAQHVLAVWQASGGPQLASAAAPALPVPAKAAPAGGIKAAEKESEHAPVTFASGGFQFSALRGHAAILPMMVQAGRAPAGVAASAISRMGGLAAYRAAPIPIPSLQ
jgi:hypothetical protein